MIYIVIDGANPNAFNLKKYFIIKYKMTCNRTKTCEEVPIDGKKTCETHLARDRKTNAEKKERLANELKELQKNDTPNSITCVKCKQQKPRSAYISKNNRFRQGRCNACRGEEEEEKKETTLIKCTHCAHFVEDANFTRCSNCRSKDKDGNLNKKQKLAQILSGASENQRTCIDCKEKKPLDAFRDEQKTCMECLKKKRDNYVEKKENAPTKPEQKKPAVPTLQHNKVDDKWIYPENISKYNGNVKKLSNGFSVTFTNHLPVSFDLKNYTSFDEALKSAMEYKRKMAISLKLVKNRYIIHDDYIEIDIGNDKTAFVDINHKELIDENVITFTNSQVCIIQDNKVIPLYKVIHNNPKNIVFKNDDVLDIRSCNLTNKDKRTDNTSGIQGVGRHPTMGYWFSKVYVDGKQVVTTFGVNKFGEDLAKKLAITCRNHYEELYYKPSMVGLDNTADTLSKVV